MARHVLSIFHPMKFISLPNQPGKWTDIQEFIAFLILSRRENEPKHSTNGLEKLLTKPWYRIVSHGDSTYIKLSSFLHFVLENAMTPKYAIFSELSEKFCGSLPNAVMDDEDDVIDSTPAQVVVKQEPGQICSNSDSEIPTLTPIKPVYTDNNDGNRSPRRKSDHSNTDKEPKQRKTPPIRKSGYKCSICGRFFTHLGGLNFHHKIDHKGEKPTEPIVINSDEEKSDKPVKQRPGPKPKLGFGRLHPKLKLGGQKEAKRRTHIPKEKNHRCECGKLFGYEWNLHRHRKFCTVSLTIKKSITDTGPRKKRDEEHHHHNNNNITEDVNHKVSQVAQKPTSQQDMELEDNSSSSLPSLKNLTSQSELDSVDGLSDGEITQHTKSLKPFKCPICKKPFEKQSAMRRHCTVLHKKGAKRNPIVGAIKKITGQKLDHPAEVTNSSPVTGGRWKRIPLMKEKVGFGYKFRCDCGKLFSDRVVVYRHRHHCKDHLSMREYYENLEANTLAKTTSPGKTTSPVKGITTPADDIPALNSGGHVVLEEVPMDTDQISDDSAIGGVKTELVPMDEPDDSDFVEGSSVCG